MSDINYPKLIAVAVLDDYWLKLEYDNGEKKIYDFKPNLNHSFYHELQSPILFKNVSVTTVR